MTGREGPMVQIAASIFLSVGAFFRRFFPKLDNMTLIAAGGASGIAAAFNTPLGGIVFVIEELVGSHFNRVRSALIVGVIVAGMTAQSLEGPYLDFGSVSLANPGWSLILPTVMLSITLGLLGGLTGKIFIEGQDWIGRRSPRGKLLLAAGLGFFLALLFLLAPLPYGAGGGIPLIRDLLWKGLEISPWLLVQRWAGMLATFLSGIAGGFFAPALALGAVCGKLAHLLFPGVHGSTLILIGMVSFLSSMARAPFTSMVLVTEMSNGHVVILPLMLASIIALSMARWVESRSYYHYQAEAWLARILPPKT